MKLARLSTRLLRRLSALALLPLGALALSSATTAEKARASSHAEAPAIADDPAMDNTDVWAWQDSANTMTIVTAWNGVSYAAGGPNYRKWTPKDQGVYEIHIDTNGDGQEDLTYQFQFTNHNQDAESFLRVTSPPTYGRLQGPSDKTQNFFQTYSVSKISGPRRNPSGVAFLASSLPVAPPNTGPQLTWGRQNGKSTPQKLIGAGSGAAPGNQVVPAVVSGANGGDYETKLASLAVQGLTSGEKVFVGPRADAFFVDLGPTFDRLKIRTFGDPIGINGAGTHGAVDVGQYGGGFNTLSGKNVEVIAIQIPIANLGGSFTLPIGGKYVGVWSSSSRRKIRVLPTAGESTSGILGGSLIGSPAIRQPQEVDAGKLVQVSRLGNPLVNELFIPYDQKDAWNGDEPRYDAAHWSTFLQNPEVATIIHAVYAVVTVPPTPRHDLAFLFAPDTLKVRVDLAAVGALNGGNGLKSSDLAFALNPVVPHTVIGFSALLGRTPADDVVDIYLKAAAGFLLSDSNLAGAVGDSQFLAGGAFPNSALGDGVDFLDSTQATPAPGSGCGITITNSFPYLGTPYDGQEARDGSGNGNEFFKTPRHN